MVSRQRTPVVIWRLSRALSTSPRVSGVGSVLLSTGIVASANGTASSSAAKASAASAMKGEWKAPLTASGMARLHCSAPHTAATAFGAAGEHNLGAAVVVGDHHPIGGGHQVAELAAIKAHHRSHGATTGGGHQLAADRCIRARPVGKSNTPAAWSATSSPRL